MKCLVCNKTTKFINKSRGYQKFCSRKCSKTKIDTLCLVCNEITKCAADKALKSGTRCKRCEANHKNQVALKFYYKNKEHCRSLEKQYYKNNKKKWKVKGQTPGAKIKRQLYYKKNKAIINQKLNVYSKKRLKIDPNYKLRCRLLQVLKNQGVSKEYSALTLLGCSVQECREHLESQFTEGMTWENHGGWHIDHIQPCSSFNLIDIEQQKKCFHYTNLQPLWKIDNLKKAAKT